MKPRILAVLLGLLALGARGEQPEDSPLREPAVPPPALPAPHYLVPALEVAAVNFGLFAFNNLVTRMAFAQVTPQSLERNLRPQSWSFDVDYYLTNQFGHAYQGAIYFTAARGSGLSFWWSTLYTTMGSLAWELFFEAEPPSVNDQITTPIAGSLLGEALRRAAAQLRGATQPRWLGLLGAGLLDPLGALNGELLESPAPVDVTLDPLFFRWQFGASAGMVVDRVDRLPRDRTPPQALVGVLLVAGAPWDLRSTYDSPLSYFDLRADLSFPSKVVGNIFIRGLVTGRRFGGFDGKLRGLIGLLGDYDYAAPAIVRASAVGLGPGLIFQLEPISLLYLQGGALLGLSPFAAAGQLLDVSADLERDYHVGPGLQTQADLRLVRPGWFQLELVIRNWLVLGAYTLPRGFESITYVTVAGTIPIWRWLGAGAEFTLSDRRASFDGKDNYDNGFSFRLLVSVMSEPHFGVGGPPR